MAWSRDQLANERCAGITRQSVRLDRTELDALLEALPGWSLVTRDGAEWLEREFRFPHFRSALDFVDRVGAAAEEQNHHPTVRLGWGWVLVSWRTFRLLGLHRNDVVMAAKTDLLREAMA